PTRPASQLRKLPRVLVQNEKPRSRNKRGESLILVFQISRHFLFWQRSQWHPLAPPQDQLSDQALLATLRLGSPPKPKPMPLLRRFVSPPEFLSPTAFSGVQLKRVFAWNRCYRITRQLLLL
ncbi:hypothetical protein POUND7_015767, partial [Theobroma cacao]